MYFLSTLCGFVEDWADDPGLPRQEGRDGLRMGGEALAAGTPVAGEPPLASVVREVLARREVPVEWACEIVRGCEMDLAGTNYRTWKELREYCYRVASAVGLVSARIFGGVHCERYAEDLGLALQITNILRDSAEDFTTAGRIYLPMEELAAFGVAPGAWVNGEPKGWSGLMQLQVGRARAFYSSALQALPDSERRVMVAAEIMRAVYGRLLEDMEKDGFQVWRRTYRLGRARKVWLMASVFIKSCF